MPKIVSFVRSVFKVAVLGAQLVSRAAVRAIKEEVEQSQQAARIRKSIANEETRRNSLGMTVDEAMNILDVKSLDAEEIRKRYEFLFAVNEKSSGGSFYLQSKIVRAKERLDKEFLENKK